MITQLHSYGLSNFEFITNYDREELGQSVIDEFYLKNKDTHKKACSISMRSGEHYEYQEMGLPSISLNMKHIEAFHRTLEQAEAYSLFLEDDCRFVKDTISIDEIILDAPDDMDVLVLGGAFDHNICSYESYYSPTCKSQIKLWIPQSSNPSNIFGEGEEPYRYLKANHPSTNTTSSILYKKSAVNKILEYLVPFCLPIDWQLNYVFSQANLNVYHLHPYLSTQGDFRSTVND